MSGPVLAVADLHVHFAARGGAVHAVRGVSFDVGTSETVAVLGPSGAGKSAMCFGALGLLPPNGSARGEVLLRGTTLSALSPRRRRRRYGREVGVVLQDPQTSLHPALPIGRQIVEGLRVHDRSLTRRAARDRAVDLLHAVGVPTPQRRLSDHPHEWSGGMRQRAAIAIAIAHDPPLLVADEPTTALDVTVQAQILELLAELQQQRSMSVLFVTHDLGVVATVADRVLVVDDGVVVEAGDVATVFRAPAHAVTRRMLEAGA